MNLCKYKYKLEEGKCITVGPIPSEAHLGSMRYRMDRRRMSPMITVDSQLIL